jgi:adenylate cyclase
MLFRLQVRLWLAAAVLFAAVNATISVPLAAVVAITVAITGLTTGACTYLLAERLLRVAATRALVRGMPEDVRLPGVATRATLAWALGTAGPVLGIVMIGVVGAAGGPGTLSQFQVAMIALGLIAVGVGLLAVTLAARATADPIDAVSDALHAVESGDLEVRVPVYDATQIGRLQLGFNRMVEGLQERERMRTALDVYVDPDVAGRIVAEGVELTGEEVDVTVMFIDVRDFTGFAEQHDPAEIIATVNRLFAVIIPIVHEHDGRIDKFVGDGLMAVFGAPRHVPAHADEALAAALEIATAVREADLPLAIGIGLNSGRVLAGNVGGAGRLEYSVMGDPVNVAARVESATRQTGDTILVSAHTRERLTRDWTLTERPGVTLKGKREAVAVFAAG